MDWFRDGWTDGRHRMLAVLDLIGDVEVPVAISIPHKRARHMGRDFLSSVSESLLSEHGSHIAEGPLFDKGLPIRRHHSGRLTFTDGAPTLISVVFEERYPVTEIVVL